MRVAPIACYRGAIDAGAANDPGSSQIRAPRAGFAAQVAAAGFIRCAGLNRTDRKLVCTRGLGNASCR